MSGSEAEVWLTRRLSFSALLLACCCCCCTAPKLANYRRAKVQHHTVWTAPSHHYSYFSWNTQRERAQPARSTASLSLQHRTKWTAAADFKHSGQLPNVVHRTTAVLSLITGDGNGNILVTHIRHLTEFDWSLIVQSQLNMWSCHETCKQKQEAMQEHTDDHVWRLIDW